MSSAAGMDRFDFALRQPTLATSLPRHPTSPEEPWTHAAAYERRTSLGSLLVREGIVTEQEVQVALAAGMQTGETLGEILVREGRAREEDIARLVALQWGLPFARPDELTTDPATVARLPLSTARELEALPIALDGDSIVVAVASPSRELFRR